MSTSRAAKQLVVAAMLVFTQAWLAGCNQEEPAPVTPAGDFGVSQAAVGEIDLLPYFCPACVGEGNGLRNQQSNGVECFYTYPATVKGRSGFYTVKSCADAKVYEEFSYDGSYIYHLADTSWATDQGGQWVNAKCYDGRPAYSTYLNGLFGSQNGSCSGFTPNLGAEGGRWAPRYMAVGARVPNGVTVVALAKDSCTCCEAQYTGPTGREIQLVSRENLDLGNGLGVRDVIRLAIVSGPGTGENFWYARGLGWVGFGQVNPANGPASLFNHTHIVGLVGSASQRQATCGGSPPSGIPLNRWISIRAAANNMYVCADVGRMNPPELIANRSAVGAWERFYVQDMGGGNVALLAGANSNYVSADVGRTNPPILVANRTSAGLWETFQWIDLGNQNFALRAAANGDLVCAENSGAQPLVANRTAVGLWETYHWDPQ